MGNTLILKLGWADAFRRDSALCLDGRITIAGEYAVAGGGYADVWQGSLDGRTVAIKVLRPFTSEGRRLRHVKLLRVCCYFLSVLYADQVRCSDFGASI
jgi:hypothetical protein